MKIVPIGLKAANEYVAAHHRHHKPVRGCKFCVSVESDGECCGVAICGRPISRYMDNGITLEITRVCTNGARNACSMLYGACTHYASQNARAARALGYKKVVTYTLLSENGASLKAANFINDGIAGGEIWSGKRKRDNGVPAEKKTRWVFCI